MLDESDLKKALFAAYKQLGYRDHSAKELREKLLNKGFTPEIADAAVEQMISYGYINDADYAKGLIRRCQISKKIGVFRIKQELKKRGIPDDLIGESLLHYSEEDEDENIDKIIKAKLKKNQPPEKILRHLFSKGFEPDKIRERLSKLKEEQVEPDENGEMDEMRENE
ncbi:MAG: recombination regulator RecX [Firmicutes bacterium]|nr:recombination regulator RecX [Bacillota bacterium]